MSADKPEVGDVWVVIKSPDVHNIIMDTSDCRGYIDFIHSYKKPDGKFVALCHTKECEYFFKHCKYLGKSKVSIKDLFCVKENVENYTQKDLRKIEDMQHDRDAYKTLCEKWLKQQAKMALRIIGSYLAADKRDMRELRPDWCCDQECLDIVDKTLNGESEE